VSSVSLDFVMSNMCGLDWDVCLDFVCSTGDL